MSECSGRLQKVINSLRWEVQVLNQERDELLQYKRNWKNLHKIIDELKEVKEGSEDVSPVDGFIKVWGEQKNRIEELEEEVRSKDKDIELLDDKIDSLGDEMCDLEEALRDSNA